MKNNFKVGSGQFAPTFAVFRNAVFESLKRASGDAGHGRGANETEPKKANGAGARGCGTDEAHGSCGRISGAPDCAGRA